MTDLNGWRPFALDTRATYRTWRCACGVETERPGLDEWQWRWLASATSHRAKRGLRTESRCKDCTAVESRTEVRG